ncbi:unnamed protein product [Paramecium sonneborni]|uniref:Uncharacterized protein n=1 Tax=Paramecium sonneborni TaxID=65129 RepID=A0A8S1L027_9CILI|nr:unnamed protein product [Paramecium sonneborni]
MFSQLQSKSRPFFTQLLDNPALLRNAKYFINESRISQQTQSAQAESNIVLQTNKLPKNLEELKEIIIQNFLLKVLINLMMNHNLRVNIFAKLIIKKKLDLTFLFRSLKSAQDRSQSIATSFQRLEMERTRQQKLLEKQKNLKIRVIHQNHLLKQLSCFQIYLRLNLSNILRLNLIRTFQSFNFKKQSQPYEITIDHYRKLIMNKQYQQIFQRTISVQLLINTRFSALDIQNLINIQKYQLQQKKSRNDFLSNLKYMTVKIISQR